MIARRFEVADRGIGISEPVLAMLFEQFSPGDVRGAALRRRPARAVDLAAMVGGTTGVAKPRGISIVTISRRARPGLVSSTNSISALRDGLEPAAARIFGGECPNFIR